MYLRAVTLPLVAEIACGYILRKLLNRYVDQYYHVVELVVIARYRGRESVVAVFKSGTEIVACLRLECCVAHVEERG